MVGGPGSVTWESLELVTLSRLLDTGYALETLGQND
jgi:hypothetical protein